MENEIDYFLQILHANLVHVHELHIIPSHRSPSPVISSTSEVGSDLSTATTMSLLSPYIDKLQGEMPRP